ncbi:MULTISPECIES: hypothetical protein [unclassified Streptomyces]|uniref:hypothetical protein n=1 Tax=unclassified Streptomyces TaxID=2593676 RepID=UPI00081F73C8|nr:MULTISPECIES: hypothetical protein [unclassified Streptomyces]MYR98359.1 hypothetical protein [Streptomyces sp. SID4937]SCE37093.1 hypothetical protein GA0115243_1115250 [Streptomyces sp. ScaeMP-e83]
MPRWGLLVEQNLGLGGQRRVWSADVLDHVDGTREEALEALRQRAEEYRPVHPASPKRRRLYRERDGFVLVLDGAWQSFHCRFTVIEELYDSAAPVPAPPAVAEPEPEPVQPPAPVRRRAVRPAPEPSRAWDADVPEVPSWLNRDRPS